MKTSLGLAVALVLMAMGACNPQETAPPATAVRDTGKVQLPATPVATPSPASSPVATLPAQARWVVPSLVRVRAEDRVGTGFAAFQSGQVLTASHNVGNPEARATVIASDGTEYTATVLAVDRAADLALLDVPRLQAPLLPLASQASPGEGVVAAGFSADTPGAAVIQRRTISTTQRDPADTMGFLQLDAPIDIGLVGGPILSAQDRVVGMTVGELPGRQSQYQSPAFAVPVEAILRFGARQREGTVGALSLPSVEPKSTAVAAAIPTPAATAPPRGQRPSTAFVVREYPEERSDGGLYIVQQWSDGRFTTPLFVRVESGASLVVKAEARNLSYLTTPGASCQTRLPEVPPRDVISEADASGRIWMTWYVPNGLPRGTVLAIEITCKKGSARVYTTAKVPVQAS